MPFKIKFPELLGDSITLEGAELAFVRTEYDPVPLAVLYDDTLVKHDDGHLTGRIQNTGDRTVHFPTIHATVHGTDSILDVAQNMELIERIAPGEIVNFAMYPDPSVTDEIAYYSCVSVYVLCYLYVPCNFR